MYALAPISEVCVDGYIRYYWCLSEEVVIGYHFEWCGVNSREWEWLQVKGTALYIGWNFYITLLDVSIFT